MHAARLAVAVCALAAVLSPARSRAAELHPLLLGLYSETVYSSDGDRRSLLDLVADAGARAIREPFDWANAEPREGLIDFHAFDRLVGEAADRGLVVVPVVWNAPDWASARPSAGAKRGMYPPRDPERFGRFVQQLARRYGPGGTFWAGRDSVVPVRSWEIWNEPNFLYFWRPAPDPAAFARLLEAAAAAIHLIDPGAEVTVGGLAATTTWRDYLRALLASPGGRSFDTLAIHPYAATVADVLAVLDTARGELDAAGLADRELTANEFGWATGGQADPEVTVDEPCQAALTTMMVQALDTRRDRLRLRSAMQFMLYDRPPAAGARDLWALHTGLLRSDWSPKPSFDAYRATARAIAAGDPAPAPGDACPERTGASPAPGAAPGAPSDPAPPNPGGQPTGATAAGQRPPPRKGYAIVTAAPDRPQPPGQGAFDPRNPSTTLPATSWLSIRYALAQAAARTGVLRAQALVTRVPVRVEATAKIRTGGRTWTRGPVAVDLHRRTRAGIVIRVPLVARRAITRARRAKRRIRIELNLVGKSAAGPYLEATARIDPRP